jgi:hypothetical protein
VPQDVQGEAIRVGKEVNHESGIARRLQEHPVLAKVRVDGSNPFDGSIKSIFYRKIAKAAFALASG